MAVRKALQLLQRGGVSRAVKRTAAAKKLRKAKAKVNVVGKARRKLAKASGQGTLRASLRKVKKRWNIPGRMRDQVEELFRDLFGGSPRGTTWSALAERYPERFKDYVDQAQEAAEEEEE
jgi:hypothetical protein